MAQAILIEFVVTAIIGAILYLVIGEFVFFLLFAGLIAYAAFGR